MAKKDKAQENYFNLHECYDSLEEFELALSKVADAASDFLHAVEDAKLPPNLANGMLSMPLVVSMEKQRLSVDRLLHSPDIISDILGGDR